MFHRFLILLVAVLSLAPRIAIANNVTELNTEWVSGTSNPKVSGANRLMTVMVMGESSGDLSATSVTYGGQTMDKRVERLFFVSGNRTYAAMFTLGEVGVNAATSGTIAVTWSTTPPPSGSAIYSVLLAGVDQANPISSTQENAFDGSVVSTSPLTAGSGDMVIMCGATESNTTITFNNGFTKKFESNTRWGDAIGGSKLGTGAAETPRFTQSPSGRMVLCAMVVKKAAVSGASGYPYWPTYHKASSAEIVPQSWSATDHIIEGWDWSLPTVVEPSPRGIMGMEREIGLRTVPQLDPKFPVNAAFIQWVYWRELEPEEGQINWQPLLDRINQCEGYGQKIIIRILTCTQSKIIDDVPDLTKGHAPRWLENRGIAMSNLSKNQWKAYDPADPLFHSHYLRLIDSLRQSGIPQMNTVQAMYVGYASNALGDEGIGPDDMDPANEPLHVKERLNAWAAAAAGVENKIFMGGPSEHGFAKGFGVRRGFVEKYLYTIPDDYIGQQVDSEGYLYVDENAFVVRTKAFNGEVNEEYEEVYATAERGYEYGTNLDSFSYRYFMSNLRLVQMRCSYVHNKETLMPQMLPWVAQQLGRTVEDTPDIWCYLNTSYLRARVLGESSQNQRTEVKNFERWIYQRDSTGYETTPVEPISNQPIGLWMTNQDIDHMAKQGSRIGFAIDDRFIGMRATPVAVKVSYLDQTSGNLTLKYHSPAGPQQKEIALTADRKLKTATFIVNDLIAPASDFNYDITLEAANGAVLTFLRIVKLEGNPVNSAPQFNEDPIATGAAIETVLYAGQTLAGKATDADVGDVLTFSKSSGPSWLVVNADGSLSGTPPAGSARLNEFIVTVTDASSLSASATLRIDVTVRPTGPTTWIPSPVGQNWGSPLRWTLGVPNLNSINPTHFAIGDCPGGQFPIIENSDFKFGAPTSNLFQSSWVGSSGSTTARLDIRSGSLSRDTSSASIGNFIVAANGKGPVLNLANTAVSGQPNLTTYGQGTGSLDVRTFTVGAFGGSSGTVNINTTGSLSTSNQFLIGSQAAGVVNLTSGTVYTTNSANGMVLGNDASGVGAFNMDGGILGDGATNRLGHISVGSKGIGTLSQTNGSIHLENSLRIGEIAGGTGTANISGGSTSVNDLLVGMAGTGNLTISNRANVTVRKLDNSVVVASSAGSSGTVNLNGGSLVTRLVRGGAGISIFNFNGGNLVATQSHVGFFQGLTEANILSGGARIDTGANDVSIAQNLQGPGGLTKLGSGTLTLSGVNQYAGGTTVSGGKLVLGTSNALPNASHLSLGTAEFIPSAGTYHAIGTLDVTGSATLNLGSGGTMAFANSSSVNWAGGSLNVTGNVVMGSSIRFGTSATGLTSTQLGLISVNGVSANYVLDSNGFLVVDLFPDFLTWSEKTAFDMDLNSDGIKDGIAWLLGAPNSNVSAHNFMPAVTRAGGNLKMNFNMLPAYERNGAELIVEYSSDLGVSDPWTAVPVPDATSNTAPVSFSVSGTNPLAVEVNIPPNPNVNGRLFVRLRAKNQPSSPSTQSNPFAFSEIE